MNKDQELKLKRRIREILLELGIATNLKGFRYLQDAIFLCCVDKNYLSEFTKGLYPKVSEIHGDTFGAVERLMRYAIRLSILHKDILLHKEIFGSTLKEKPTNSQFIGAVVSYLELNY